MLYTAMPQQSNASERSCPSPSEIKAWQEALLLDYPKLTRSMADFILHLHLLSLGKGKPRSS